MQADWPRYLMRGRPCLYVLEGHTPRPVLTQADYDAYCHQWERDWNAYDGPRVACTRVGASEVSTVFLGTDHQFGDGPPLLYETLIFSADPAWHQQGQRYATYADAEAGHAGYVAALGQGAPSAPTGGEPDAD